MQSNTQWKGKSYGGKFGHAAFVFLLRAFGLRAAYCLLVFVAFYFVFFKRGIYTESAAYLKRAIAPRRAAMPFHVYRHVYNFGKILIDKWAYYMDAAKIEIDNSASESVKTLIANGAGMLAVNAHIGAWDVAANLLRQTYGRDIFILGLNTEDEDIEALLKKNRTIPQVETLDADKLSIIGAYKLLKGGAIVAMQSDRLIENGRFTSIDFFGAKVKIPLAAFSLARHAEVPLVQIHCVRTAYAKYKVIAFPPLNNSDSETEQAQAYAKNLEEVLKKYPYQWANFYNFFGDERTL